MENKDDLKNQNEIDETNETNEEESKKNRFKVNLAILLVVIVMFGGIMLLTGFVGELFGKTTENIVLGAVACILAVMLWQTNKKK